MKRPKSVEARITTTGLSLCDKMRAMSVESYTSYGTVPFFKKDGEILFLIVRHADGHWGFPKGHQDFGETPLQTAKRELFEETGIEDAEIRENIRFEEHYQYEDGGTVFNKTVVYFLTEAWHENTRTPVDFAKEIPEIRWVSFEEGMKTLIFEESKEILKQAHETLREGQA